MKILVSGASGLVGSELLPALAAAQHTVNRLVRDRSRALPGDVYWNPVTGELDAQAIADCDAIVNLAGESIAAGRWTKQRKQKILSSRVDGTRTIATALAKLSGRPLVLVNASAIGYYGNRGDERLTEASPSGQGDFLSEVCRAWEVATEPAEKAGVRVVKARFGVILSSAGGALQKMLLPFKLGLGGPIGSGRQFMSWIALDDVVGAIVHALVDDSLAGPVNVVSPHPVTNKQFTKTLGRALWRPTLFPMPAFAARLVFGQMGDELLLASQRVEPVRLLGSSYRFKYPDLRPALGHLLGRPVGGPDFSA